MTANLDYGANAMDDLMRAYKTYRLEKMLRSAKADKTLEALLPVLIITWIASVGFVFYAWLSHWLLS